MKRAILFAIFAAAFAVTTSIPAVHAADQKDFSIKVHVSSSEIRGWGPGLVECITVLIDGKKYELARSNVSGKEIFPIHPGDYQARMVKDGAKGAGQFDRDYELLFGDGKTERYHVVGESE